MENIDNKNSFSINPLNFILALIITFVISLVLFGISFFVIPTDIIEWQAEHGRPEGDSLRILGTIGHILQILFFVLLFYVFIKSRKAKIGILYGFLMGCYLSSINLTVLGAFNVASESFTYSMIPVNIIIGIITGWILTLIYRD
jgi:hypothetical protein